ncbi:hypothetical protein KBC85_01150 [Candidatus Saccharibacteria bacterium]|nr:hypothetical protein [Candidatus Saccharibacteria bacterium]
MTQKNQNTQKYINYSALNKKFSLINLFTTLKTTPKNKVFYINLGAIIVLYIALGAFALFLLNKFGANWYWYILIIFILMVILTVGLINEHTKDKRIELFAGNNGFKYVSNYGSYKDNGLPFEQLDFKNSSLNNVISGEVSGYKFYFGNYVYDSSEATLKTYKFGLVALDLKKDLPNIYINSKSNDNNVYGQLVTGGLGGYKRSQKFDLEGDFSTYFNVYAPRDYERDTLYILTPELMEHIVNYGKDFDLEIVDSYLKLYRPNKLIEYNEKDLDYIFTIIMYFGNEFTQNTKRYKDDRKNVDDELHKIKNKLEKRFYA